MTRICRLDLKKIPNIAETLDWKSIFILTVNPPCGLPPEGFNGQAEVIDCLAQIRRVNRFFENHGVDRAIEKVFTDAGINYGASTDYGLTLRRFRRHYLDAVNK